MVQSCIYWCGAIKSGNLRKNKVNYLRMESCYDCFQWRKKGIRELGQIRVVIRIAYVVDVK
jgi:hypothetical protein